MLLTKLDRNTQYLHTLSNMGIALSAVKDHERLLEMIVSSAMDLTNCDGCTIYLVKNNTQLNIEIFANKSLNILPKKVNEMDFLLPSVSLYLEGGQKNFSNIASYCYFEGYSQVISDAYQAVNFDFSGTRESDKKLGYHSKSFLTIPLEDHENKIIGVLELINAMDEDTGEIISFSAEKIQFAESFASYAATALTKHELILAQKKLFESLIKLIAQTIDEKCAYTSNHCSRVPIITSLIADAVNHTNSGAFKSYHLTSDQIEELRVAAWMHDCGKIAIPEHVINKRTKLEHLQDGINLIILKIEIIKRDLKISQLEQHISREELSRSSAMLDDALQFLKKVNIGSEFISDEQKEKISKLSKLEYKINGKTQPLLTPEEVANLNIARGTLNEQERNLIQSHVVVTKKILQSLTYPEYLKMVPEIAGNHHEHVDGHGYPSGLSGAKMSVQSRIVAIADIFEALTAADRPYRKPNTLSEALKIMSSMKASGHIDPDLYDLFIEKKLYLQYAEKYLKPEQIDL